MPMSARIPVFAANWKMNTTVSEGLDLCRDVVGRLRDLPSAEVIVCPPFTHLVPMREILVGSPVRLGAQNVYSESKGAFTGEVSPTMLQGLASHVIVGHSERRLYFGETDSDVHRKLQAAYAANLTPILCVGETGDQRQSGETEVVLSRQISVAIEQLNSIEGLIVAYEPVWAIGTGLAADGPQAQTAIAYIRSQIRLVAGDMADATRVLYGGSVTAANIAAFMAQPDVDGALVGGASLLAESFADIVYAGARTKAPLGNG
jgi:triosephosphate isomerase